jgi:hypothetical protein
MTSACRRHCIQDLWMTFGDDMERNKINMYVQNLLVE